MLSAALVASLPRLHLLSVKWLSPPLPGFTPGGIQRPLQLEYENYAWWPVRLTYISFKDIQVPIGFLEMLFQGPQVLLEKACTSRTWKGSEIRRRAKVAAGLTPAVQPWLPFVTQTATFIFESRNPGLMQTAATFSFFFLSSLLFVVHIIKTKGILFPHLRRNIKCQLPPSSELN